jgi:aminoglycoside phosphotransferase (APT) family kinase protein
VSDVQQIVGLDPAAVTRWFDTLGVEFTAALSFERIGLGQSNLTFLVRDVDDRKWVLRRPPLGQLLASAHDVVREARILAALEGTAVPAPKVYGVAHDAAVSEVRLVLMEFIDGQVVDTMPIAESLTPQRRRAIGVSLPQTLAKIHAVDLDAVGLRDLASHKPYAQRQLKRWSAQWEQSKTRELPELDDLTRRLAAAVPEQRELTLVHGDFHLRNVIASHETGEVIGALDWELSTLGDPLADMGSLLAYWPEPGEHTGNDFPAATLEGFPDRSELARIYLDETGRDAEALQFWHVLGLWKVAVIAEGVLRRTIDAPQNRAAAATPTLECIDALVHHACEIADGAGI